MKKLLLFCLLFLTLFISGCNIPGGNKKGEDIPSDKEKIEQLVQENLAKISSFINIDFVPETDDLVSEITIYTVNDFHGALLEVNGTAGAARLGQYLITKKNENPNGTIILAAGDMFQGTAISNYRYGLDVINWMNAVKFDAMTIGNHEFDWNLNEILKYRDSDLSNGEANFPLLGANIYQKSIDNIPNNLEPYTIIERGGVKIGVIGYIGYGLENDIATSMVADYRFEKPVLIIETIANYLREEEKVDIVIALGHDGSDATNSALVASSSKIDAIINGHLHLEKTDHLSGSKGRLVPIVQAGSSGAYIGEITFTINPNTKEISNSFVRTIKMDSYLPENPSIKAYLEAITNATAPLFSRVIGVAGKRIYNRNDVVQWAVNALKEQKSVDVAFINYGGIRSDAFPIDNDEKITISKVYQIMPFDNTIKLVKLSGAVIRGLMESDLAYSSNLQKSGSYCTIDNKILEDNKLYTVASIDFVFDQEKYPFLKGTDIVVTGELFRNTIIYGIEELTKKQLKWIP